MNRCCRLRLSWPFVTLDAWHHRFYILTGVMHANNSILIRKVRSTVIAFRWSSSSSNARTAEEMRQQTNLSQFLRRKHTRHVTIAPAIGHPFIGNSKFLFDYSLCESILFSWQQRGILSSHDCATALNWICEMIPDIKYDTNLFRNRSHWSKMCRWMDLFYS